LIASNQRRPQCQGRGGDHGIGKFQPGRPPHGDRRVFNGFVKGDNNQIGQKAANAFLVIHGDSGMRQ